MRAIGVFRLCCVSRLMKLNVEIQISEVNVCHLKFAL
jgi:hypothetical protein